MGIGLSFFTEGVERGLESTWTSSGSAWPMAANCVSIPPARRSYVSACKARGQGHERRSRVSFPRSSAYRPRTSRSSRRRHRQHPVRARHVWLVVHPCVRRGCRGGGPADQGQGQDHRRGRGRALTRRPRVAEHGRWYVKGDPEKGKTIQEIAFASHGNLELPEGVEGHLDATAVYNPPNLTYPFGAYICVVDVDRDRPGEGPSVHRGR